MDIKQIDNYNKLMQTKELRKNLLLYPSERLVVFLAKNYPNIEENYRRTALDIGSGSGRHIKLLLEYGFTVSGIDYTDESCEIVARNFSNIPHFKGIYKADLNTHPFSGEFFDVVLCWGVIFLRPVSGMLEDLRIIMKLLKEGGKLVVNFRTKENWFYGKGREIARNTFFLNDEAGSYKNMTYTFLELEEARSILEEVGFRVLNTEKEELWQKNLTERHSWWVFWAEKPNTEE